MGTCKINRINYSLSGIIFKCNLTSIYFAKHIEITINVWGAHKDCSLTEKGMNITDIL